jgi:hypothetical protein
MDGGGGDGDRPGAEDQKAEGGVGGSAGEPPDAVQPGAGVVEDAVAQERQRVGGGQDTGGPGEPAVVSIPIVVDFPAPFGPSSPNTSPGAAWKSIPLTASTPPG